MRHLEAYDPQFRQEISGTVGDAIELELLEKERVVITKFVRQLLDKGWTVKLAFQHLKEMSIPEEKLNLIRETDLLIPQVSNVEPSGNEKTSRNNGGV